MPPSPGPTTTPLTATPWPPQGQALPLGEDSWWLSPGSKLESKYPASDVPAGVAVGDSPLRWLQTLPRAAPEPCRCRPQIADSLFESHLPPTPPATFLFHALWLSPNLDDPNGAKQGGVGKQRRLEQPVRGLVGTEAAGPALFWD